MRRLLLLSALIFVAAFGVSTLAFALQDAPVIAKPSVDTTIVGVITGLSAVVTPWVIFGVSRLLPKLPRVVLPLLPFAFAFLTDQIANLTAGVSSPIGVAGLAYITFLTREIPNTFFRWGLSGGGGLVFPDKK